MADLTYYAAKIAECLRLVESSNDPLYRDVYQAMADEFAEKYAALSPRAVGHDGAALPPSPLLTDSVPSGKLARLRRERRTAAPKPASDDASAPEEALSTEPGCPVVAMRRP